MRAASILYPVFVQVALTLVLLFLMGNARVAALRKGEVKVGDIALGQQAWPTRPAQYARSFHNQLEMPILFYAVVALALATNAVTAPMIWLAWAFVALRLVHVAVHIGGNDIRRRFLVYLAGVVALAAMWALLAFATITAA